MIRYCGVYKNVDIYKDDNIDNVYYYKELDEYVVVNEILDRGFLHLDVYCTKERCELLYNNSHLYTINGIQCEIRTDDIVCYDTLTNKYDFSINSHLSCSKVVLKKYSKHQESYTKIYDYDNVLKIVDYIKLNNFQVTISDNITNKRGVYKFTFTPSSLYLIKYISGEDIMDYNKKINHEYVYACHQIKKYKNFYNQICDNQSKKYIKLLSSNSSNMTNSNSVLHKLFSDRIYDIPKNKDETFFWYQIYDEEYFNFIVNNLINLDVYLIKEFGNHPSHILIYENCKICDFNLNTHEILISISNVSMTETICNVKYYYDLDILNDLETLERKIKINRLLK